MLLEVLMLRILQEVLAMKGLSCCYDLSDMLKAKLQFIGHEFVEFLQGI